MDPKERNLRPVKEALKIIPVSREAFYRKLHSGELPCYRFGRKILVDVEECLRAMRLASAGYRGGTSEKSN